MTQKLIFREGKKMMTWFCKTTLAAAVTSLTSVAASPAQTEECSNASLKGKYAQTISGQLLPGPGVVLPQNGVAMASFDGKGKSHNGILLSLMAHLPPLALLPKRAPMRFTPTVRAQPSLAIRRGMDRSRARDYKSPTRVSHRCISADHGRKPGAGEYRQQWYACGRRGWRLRNISRPSPL
jgi:hypothetical protein